MKAKRAQYNQLIQFTQIACFSLLLANLISAAETPVEFDQNFFTTPFDLQTWIVNSKADGSPPYESTCDSWNDEFFQILVDKTNSVFKQSFQMDEGTDICGNNKCENQPTPYCNQDLVLPIDVIKDHYSGSLEIQLQTGLNQKSNDESFGIREYQLYLYQCDVSCGTGCTFNTNADCANQICATGYFNYLGKCITSADCPTKTFYDSTANNCLNCDSTCKTCETTKNQCLTCYSSDFFLSNTCYTKCPSTYYDDVNSQTCMKCNTLCLDCSGPAATQCLSCPSGKYLNTLTNQCIASCKTVSLFTEGSSCVSSCSGANYQYSPDMTCVSACPTNNYYPTTTGPKKCLPCDSACLQCTGALISECQACITNGYFLASPSTCTPCDSKCATCTGANSNQCLSCATNFYLHSNTECLNPCPDFFFNLNGVCTNCSTGCLTCNGALANNCLTCDVGLFYYPKDKTCTSTCPTGSYSDTATTCAQCDNTCDQCTGPSANQCSKCKLNSLTSVVLFQEANSCIPQCAAGKFGLIGTASAGNTCEICNSVPTSYCLECSALDQCTVCDQASTYQYLDSTSFTCTDTCPVGLYKDSSVPNAEQCVSNCPLQYFQNTLTSNCDPCDPSCAQCVDLTYCTVCSPLFFLYNNLCPSTCPDDYFPQTNPNVCKLCFNGDYCLSCQTDTLTEKCLSCHNQLNRYLRLLKTTDTTGQCLVYDGSNPAPDGFYFDIVGNKILPCDSRCTLCTDGTNNSCSSCTTGSYLIGTTCDSTCPSYYYPNSSSSKCATCVADCQTCVNGTECQKCAPNFYLTIISCADGCYDPLYPYQYTATQTCYQVCPPGSYAVETPIKQCKPCNLPCKDCTGPTDKECLSCQPLLYFLDLGISGKQCVSSCPCNIAYFADVSPSMVCVQSCKTKFFTSSTTCKCQPCDATCQECTGPLYNQCSQCSGALYLKGTECLTKTVCQSLVSYGRNIDNVCDNCNATCLTCFGPNNTQCFSCAAGFVLSGTDCLPPSGGGGATMCPNGQYTNLVTRKCEQICDFNLSFYPDKVLFQCYLCPDPCLYCYWSDNCVVCKPGYYLFNKYCHPTCPDQYYQTENPGVCNPCLASDNCQTCIDANSRQCLTCYETNKDQYLMIFDHVSTNGICFTKTVTPPNNFYFDADNIYQPCHPYCKQCFGQLNTECSLCNEYSYLYMTTCESSCPQGYLKNSVSWVCVACPKNCDACLDTVTCQTCSSGFLYAGGNCVTTCVGEALYQYKLTSSMICVSKCPTHTFPNLSADNECQQCSIYCQECTNSSSQDCTQCYYPKILDNGECVDSCSCLNPAPAVKKFLDYPSNSCLEICKPGTFEDDVNCICAPCYYRCATCHGSEAYQCDSCLPGFFLFNNNECLSETECNNYSSMGNKINGICEQCFNRCSRCTVTQAADKCTRCLNPYVLNGSICQDPLDPLFLCSPSDWYINLKTNQCVSACDPALGVYPSVDTFGRQICQVCPIQCSMCTSQTVCQACTKLYFYQEKSFTCIQQCNTVTPISLINQLASPQILGSVNQCVSSCETGFYLNFTFSICEPCLASCKTCTAEKKCQTCETGFYLNNVSINEQTCLTSCPSRTYQDSTTWKCLTCSAVCNDCQTINDNCTNCAISLVLYLNKCRNACPDGFYAQVDPVTGFKFCQPCINVCKTCVGPSNLECYSCQEFTTAIPPDPALKIYYAPSLLSCVTKCDVGFYLSDISPQQCLQCDSSCLTCHHSGPTSCQTCPLNVYFLTGSCLVKCPSGYYSDEQNLVCIVCPNPCGECKGLNPNTDCLSCNSNTLLLKLPEGNCITQSICSTHKNTFIDPVRKTCEYCYPTCSLCDKGGWESCLECADLPTVYQLNWIGTNLWHCNDFCPSGYSQVPSTMGCILCTDSQCQKCKDDQPGFCLECKTGLYLNDGICYQGCPPPLLGDPMYSICVEACNGNLFYDSGSSTCLICKPSCGTCNGPLITDCITCSQAFPYRFNGLCNEKCPPKYYSDIDNVCQQCPDYCVQCTDTGCIKSEPNYRLTNSLDPSDPKNQIICEKCSDANCIVCDSAADICQVCQENFDLTDVVVSTSSKIVTCTCDKIGYSQISNVCSQCLVKDCIACTNADFECTACRTPFILSSDQLSCNNPTCPKSNQFFFYLTLTCIECPPYCEKCNQQGCVECALNSQQKQTFKIGYFDCVPCQVKYCQNCSQDSQICQECSPNFGLFQNQCWCPTTGFNLDTNTNECQQCLTNHCIQCVKDIYFCDRCDIGYVYDIDQRDCVIPQCFSNQYFDEKTQTCIYCSQGCLSCDTSANCSQCRNGMRLSSSTNPISCQLCFDPLCNVCDRAPHICQECVTKNFKIKNIDYIIEPPIYPLPISVDTSGSTPISSVNGWPRDSFLCSCQEPFLGQKGLDCVWCLVSECFKCQFQDSTKNPPVPSKFFQNGQCLECSSGFYLNQTENICYKRPCITKYCYLCNEQYQCTTCQPDFTLTNIHQCVCEKKGFMLFEEKCTQCGNFCTQCEETPSKCTECEDYYRLNQISNTCQPFECGQIFSQCEVCDELKQICTKCNHDYEFKLNSQGKEVCLHICHYSCKKCQEFQVQDYQCIQCPETRLLIEGKCVCKAGYQDTRQQECEKTQSIQDATETMMQISSALSAVSMASGVGLFCSLRAIDIGQMLSFNIYNNINFRGQNEVYLKAIYNDHLTPLIPNEIAKKESIDLDEGYDSKNSQETKIIRRYLQVVDSTQLTERRFMRQGKTASFLYNCFPLLIIYLVTTAVLLIKWAIFKFTRLQYSKNQFIFDLQKNLNQNIYLLVFYLTFHEETLLVLLQIKQPSFAQEIFNLSFAIACIFSVHIVVMLFIIFRAIFRFRFFDNHQLAEHFGPIFSGLQRVSTAAKYLILVKFAQQISVVFMIVYLATDIHIYGLISAGILVLLYELSFRPYDHIAIFLVTISLNILFVVSLILILFIEKAEQTHIEQDIQSYNQKLELTLLIYIIIKNIIVMLDVIFCLLMLQNICQTQKAGDLIDQSQNMELTSEFNHSTLPLDQTKNEFKIYDTTVFDVKEKQLRENFAEGLKQNAVNFGLNIIELKNFVNMPEINQT